VKILPKVNCPDEDCNNNYYGVCLLEEITLSSLELSNDEMALNCESKDYE